MELRYWLLLIVLGAIWGSAFIFIKIATPELGSIFLVSSTCFGLIYILTDTFTKKIQSRI